MSILEVVQFTSSFGTILGSYVTGMLFAYWRPTSCKREAKAAPGHSAIAVNFSRGVLGHRSPVMAALTRSDVKSSMAAANPMIPWPFQFD
jgi:hypothetical protein